MQVWQPQTRGLAEPPCNQSALAVHLSSPACADSRPDKTRVSSLQSSSCCIEKPVAVCTCMHAGCVSIEAGDLRNSLELVITALKHSNLDSTSHKNFQSGRMGCKVQMLAYHSICKSIELQREHICTCLYTFSPHDHHLVGWQTLLTVNLKEGSYSLVMWF